MFSTFRNREIRRGDSGWFGWYRKRSNSTQYLPSNDLGTDTFPSRPDAFPEDLKPAVPQKDYRRQFSPLIISKVDIPQTVRTPLLAESQPQYTTQGPTTMNPSHFEAAQPPAVSRQATQNTAKESYTMASTHINNTYSTNRASLSQSVANSYGAARRMPNRMSEQSSLSSGFGDGQIIIPDSTSKSSTARPSPTNNGRVRNFSWVTSIFQARSTHNRDSTYTTSSEDTTKRYRTVNSWVAQQTRHVERREQSDREIPSMPQAPLPMAQNANEYPTRATEDSQGYDSLGTEPSGNN